METTPNNNIKIVRLHSGEDIMANYHADDENETIMLENPMNIIFKRIPTGQTVMMMMPWLPIEIIKDNSAILYASDILTIIEPKDDLIRYYGEMCVHAQERLENSPSLLTDDEEEDEDDEENDIEEMDSEELFEMLKLKKNNKLH